jgi:methionyl aminopeptidase
MSRFFGLLLAVNVLFVAAFAPTRSKTSPMIAVGRSTKIFMNKKKGKQSSSKSSSRGFGSTLDSQSPSSFPYAGSIRPGTQSTQRIVVDKNIVLPDYALDGIPKKGKSSPLLPWIIEVKKPEEIEKMRAAGKLAREILDMAGKMVEVGITTDEIDSAVHEAIVAAGAYPSPLNYHGFPKSCCTSVNEVICHGIPDDRKLKEGDIINVDITTYLDGYHGDCSEMFVAGEPDPDAKQLLQVTYDCWIEACKYVKPGRDYKDLGAIIEDHIVPEGLSTVRNFCGHGIGSVFHTTPNILHYRNNEPNGSMACGHTFTIEPMICEGTAKVLSWPDDWTATTVDGKRSAQFEHTLLVTNDGVEALTAKNEKSMLQFWEKDSKVHKGFFLGTSQAAIERAEEVASKLAL